MSSTSYLYSGRGAVGRIGPPPDAMDVMLGAQRTAVPTQQPVTSMLGGAGARMSSKQKPAASSVQSDAEKGVAIYKRVLQMTKGDPYAAMKIMTENGWTQ